MNLEVFESILVCLLKQGWFVAPHCKLASFCQFTPNDDYHSVSACTDKLHLEQPARSKKKGVISLQSVVSLREYPSYIKYYS